MLWYSTTWTAPPFSNDPLWLTLLVEGVNDHLLVHCQISSVIHYCGFIYIYAFSRLFYPKRLTVHSGYKLFISTCVPWELNPQPFALLTQFSTTEPEEHFKEQEIPRIYTVWMVIYWSSNVNILIFWDTGFLLSLAVNSNHQNKIKKRLTFFTLNVMNLKYMKVLLFEISYKTKLTFSPYY